MSGSLSLRVADTSQSYRRPASPARTVNFRKKKEEEMVTKATTLSDLIHRAVTSSCLNLNINDQERHLSITHHLQQQHTSSSSSSSEEQEGEKVNDEVEREIGTEEDDGSLKALTEMELLMEEVFDTITSMKKAYVSLQEAHCPWDPHRMRAADESVVVELRKLTRLRDTFRRNARNGINSHIPSHPPPLRDAVVPYEAALSEARREVKLKEAEIEGLRDKLRSATTSPGGKKGKSRLSARRSVVLSSSATIPTPELFIACVDQVKSSAKSFATHLISLMRSSKIDINAAVNSIMVSNNPQSVVGSHHARHVMECYMSRKMFQGFEHESFYMEGTLSSLLTPDHHRATCFGQFKDMRSMDPSELLGILPTCQFGKWSAKKFLSIMDSNMEVTLVRGGKLTEHRKELVAGEHPRTQFYGEYLRMAKAVWLLHLLAFAVEPSPVHFEASNGAAFQPEFMESVVRFPGDRVPSGWVVGFGVGPGFKLGNGSIIKARVYPLPPSADLSTV